tara:strand:+ start:1062 stop:1187 length:126 start_codon:yes stop_codon:yes gene_type:complete
MGNEKEKTSSRNPGNLSKKPSGGGFKMFPELIQRKNSKGDI